MENEKRQKLMAKIKEIIEKKKKNMKAPLPSPRYDEVYFKGLEELGLLD